MRVNHARQRLRAGESVVGCAVHCYRESEIARVLGAAGFDYFFLDLEHGAFNLETARDFMAAAVSTRITPLARVAELRYSLVARLLDIGAQGIVLPRVEDPALLAEALSWMRYPPAGKRGFGVFPSLVDYEPHGMPAIIEHLNANTLAVVQFESGTAMERADELLSVPGVDVAMVGPADLSISLGIPGEIGHPRQIALIERFIERCNAHGVVPGIHCPNVQDATAWLARGMRFVGSGSEQGMLIEKAGESAAALRAAARP